ncbi:AfsR/SARP family transcriptional regulator [Kitasatospora sp. NBC_01539]|uniref:AfsR/SARP family transcriptional regulator n=1 Tax=Kitasatospora sp. NBC_01539 TaxID=2903577 RepID=UPI00386014BE
MHYGILGTTTAHHDDGTPVPLGGARLRALLAALALRQGRPVPADLLVDEVWGDDPPQDASAALQTLVGRLRRTVGRDEVGSGPSGYWLAGGGTDAGDFQRLAADGRRALAAGDPREAADLLRAALALWRGPALADLPDRAGAAVRLEAQRDEARRHRITADLALGRAADLTAELAELCAGEPLDEPLHALLLRALQAEGRTAEALQRYDRLRRALADRLGTDPGPELRALHAGLLAAGDAPAPAAARPGPAADPAPEAVPAPRAVEARPPTRPAPVGNLRPRLTSFVGRDTDLASVGRALAAGRLTTLTGPGGSGKTRLSLEAGRVQLADGAWPDGVWMAELAPLEDAEAVPEAVVAALGLRETVLHTGSSAVAEAIDGRRGDPVFRLVEHCAGRRMLLVLDNCEHLIQAAADLADRLLAECPGLTVLATSREPLGVPGEAVLPVEPLPDPAALRLLAERGAAARPGFDPADDPEACAEICRRLDGLPLAIELAAARLRGLTPRQLADRLDGRFALLTAGSRTLLPRQQTLRAVVDWSWDLLGRRERAVLRRLSVFAGGCTLEAAEDVVADGAEVHREDVADLLLSLVDKSLVVADLDGGPRYAMLETIHEYAAERLSEAAEDEAAARQRHVRCFRELVRAAELSLHGPAQLHWLSVLDRDQENIRAALRTAVDRADEEEALLLALGMSWFWSLRDYRREAHSWFEAVTALGPDAYADDAEPPQPLLAGPLDAPPPLAPAMLAEARRQVQLHRLVAMFTGNMAMLGDHEAMRISRRVLETYTPDLPQSYRFPVLLRVFGAFLTGEFDRMTGLMDDAVAGARRHGRPIDLAFALQLRARLLNDLVGGLDQAVADSAEALELFTAAGDLWGMSEALSAQAENAAKQGDDRRAAAAYRQAIGIAEELGASQEVPLLQVRLGETLFGIDPVEGERMVLAALEEVRASGNHAADGATMYGRLVLCNLRVRQGDHAAALRELDELLLTQSTLGPIVPDVFFGVVACIRGWVVARAGDAGRGLELMIGGRRRMTASPGGATVFVEHMAAMLLMPAAGVVLALAEQQALPVAAYRAGVLVGAADVLHGSMGSHMERVERERLVGRLEELLGADGLRAAREEGGRLSLAEAAALLDGLGSL